MFFDMVSFPLIFQQLNKEVMKGKYKAENA